MTNRLSSSICRGLAAVYVFAQVACRIACLWMAHLMFELPILQSSVTERTETGPWVAEAVATFGLVATIFGVAARTPVAVPYAVGLYITSAYWFTASTSFANPAATIVRSLSNTLAGIAQHGVWAFIAAQLVGADLAIPLARWLWPAANLDSEDGVRHRRSPYSPKGILGARSPLRRHLAPLRDRRPGGRDGVSGIDGVCRLSVDGDASDALQWASPKQTAALSAPFVLANSAVGLVGVVLAGQFPSSHFVLYAIAALGGAIVGTAIGLRWLSQASTRLVLAGILFAAGIRLVFF